MSEPTQPMRPPPDLPRSQDDPADDARRALFDAMTELADLLARRPDDPGRLADYVRLRRRIRSV